jgi:VWFA-related protein
MRARVFVPILRRLGLALFGLGILLGPGRGERAARAQTPSAPPTFPAGVEIITVDAVVLDAQGRPVGGLTRDDFRVFEDNRPQEIVGFEAFSGEPAEEASGSPSAVASNESESRSAGRAFMVLLDDLRIDPERAVSAREAAASFLERSVRDRDEVTLGTTSGDAWWSARIPEGREDLLAVLGRVKGRYVRSSSLDRLTDYEAFWINSHEDSPALASLQPDRPASAPAAAAPPDPNQAGGSIKERVKQRWKDANLCTGTSCDGMVRDLAADVDAQRKARTRAALQAVRRGLEAVAPVHGRKSLLFLSEGFIDDPNTDERGVLAAAREANAAVYFVDVRGLVALSDVGSAGDAEQYTSARDRATSAFENTVLESAGAEALAEDTGGFSVKNSNDLAMGAERIGVESRVFYLLGLHPLPGKSARDWRKLRVEVKRPGLKVRARRGYTLGAGAAADQAARKRGKKGNKDNKDNKGVPDPTVVQALDSAHDATGIPLRVIAYVFEPLPKGATRVVVAAEFDVGAIPAAEKGRGRAGKLDLSIVATHRDTGHEFRFDEVLGIRAPEAGAPTWRAVARELDLPPGVAQVRVVARDPASGALGSVSQRLDVPPGSAFRLSTPVLTDRMEPATGGAKGRPRPDLCAHRVFQAAGGLYLQFEVFGAARTGGRAAPDVTAGLTVRAPDGRVVRHAPPSPIAADPDGRLVRFVGIGLDGLEPGPYDLSLDVRDAASGERLEDHEMFTLVRDAAPR